MFPGIDRLKTLKVRDVMSRTVIEVAVNQTMEDAAEVARYTEKLRALQSEPSAEIDTT